MPLLSRTVLPLCLLLIMGCASFRPQPLPQVPFPVRTQTQQDGHVQVTVAVPSEAETQAIFGVSLYDDGVQPVWLEVENHEDRPFWFLSPGLDPGYFSPLEASYVNHYSVLRLAGKTNRAMDDYFRQMAFTNPVVPGAIESGFIFTNLDRGFKTVDVDLVGRDRMINMTFIVPVPGLQTRADRLNFHALYTYDEIIEYEEEQQFRAALEQLPCGTTNQQETKNGDPLNLVLIGDPQDIFPAFIRRGWHPTEVLQTATAWKTFKAAIFGSRYRYSPISALYAYGRPQDIEGQKARTTIHQRNHLRLWLTPLRFQGKLVWLGQISRDIGSRFTTQTWWFTTHKIDPDVDEARNGLIQDLAYSQALAKIGLVKGVGAAPPDNPRTNLTGDPYFTDGLRAVLVFDHRPVALSAIGFFNWEVPSRVQPYRHLLLEQGLDMTNPGGEAAP